MFQPLNSFCDALEARFHLKTLLDGLCESLGLLEKMAGIEDDLMESGDLFPERRRSAKRLFHKLVTKTVVSFPPTDL